MNKQKEIITNLLKTSVFSLIDLSFINKQLNINKPKEQISLVSQRQKHLHQMLKLTLCLNLSLQTFIQAVLIIDRYLTLKNKSLIKDNGIVQYEQLSLVALRIATKVFDIYSLDFKYLKRERLINIDLNEQESFQIELTIIKTLNGTLKIPSSCCFIGAITNKDDQSKETDQYQQLTIEISLFLASIGQIYLELQYLNQSHIAISAILLANYLINTFPLQNVQKDLRDIKGIQVLETIDKCLIQQFNQEQKQNILLNACDLCKMYEKPQIKDIMALFHQRFTDPYCSQMIQKVYSLNKKEKNIVYSQFKQKVKAFLKV